MTTAYKGATYRVGLDRGGWMPNPNQDLIPPEAMVDVTNINLDRGGRETRGGTLRINTNPIGGAPRIMGLIQYRKKDGNSFIVVGTDDGRIIANYTTTLKSGWGASTYVNFVVFRDKLYAFNGSNRPQVWDGVAGSTSDLANIPADWTGSNWPKAAIVHGRGVSERLWAYGVPGKLEKLYASGTGSDNFADGTVTVLSIETGDGYGIVALASFLERLVPISKSRAYLVVDNDPDPAKWGYEKAQWEGGVASERLLVRTPNDLIAMDDNGHVYSVITSQTVGDQQAVSLTRPAFVHVWIRDNVNLTALNQAHMAFDPELRAIKVFVMRNGESRIETALVYFIDRPAVEAWSRHRYYNQDLASVSALVREGTLQRVYLGGYAGFVYRTEDSARLDDGAPYDNYFRHAYLTFNDPRSRKRYDRAWLVTNPKGNEQIHSYLFVDGAAVAGGFQLVGKEGSTLYDVVDENGNLIIGYEFTPFEFIPDETPPLTDLSRTITSSHAIGATGIRLQSEIHEVTGGARMYLSQLMYDFVPLGPAAS